jgi:4-amino-4-deoxy-L-arabinose transferase-like glycosyltransferase
MKKHLSLWILMGIFLVAGYTVRLYKIDNPVADWHSWRQADTAAVTRNYVKYGIRLLYPRYDDYSDVSGKGLFNPHGYRFVEFPIYNLIHYSLFSLFGSHTLEYWGRMTTVLVSLISSVLLFLIVAKHSSRATGLLAMFFFLFVPFNIFYSRVILPDPLMVTFYLAAIYLFEEYLQEKNNIWFSASAVCAGLAVLVKPVGIFFLFPIVWRMLQVFGRDYFKSRLPWIFAGITLIPFGLWRAWSFRFPEGMPASAWLLNGNHIRFRPAFFGWIFHQRIGTLILGVWGVGLLLPGIFESLAKKSYFFSWGIASLVYLFTFATGNVQHDYYQIPIIPSLAIFLALGTLDLWRKTVGALVTWGRRLTILACIGFMLYFSWYDVKGNGIKGYYQINHWEIVHAGQAVDKLAPKDAVVVAPYLGDTAFLYQTNRPGFAHLPKPIKDLIDGFEAGYYVSVNLDDTTRAIMAKYTVVAQTPEYVIVKLIEPRL